LDIRVFNTAFKRPETNYKVSLFYEFITTYIIARIPNAHPILFLGHTVNESMVLSNREQGFTRVILVNDFTK
jgi:hypothetical protein